MQTRRLAPAAPLTWALLIGLAGGGPTTLAGSRVERDRYLVHYHRRLDSPQELRLRLGPTGAWGWANGHTIVVRGCRPTSPADGVLRKHDVITGANDRPFAEGKDPRRELAHAITDSETEEGKGRLVLSLVREGRAGKVTIRLPVLGSYRATWPFDCPKSRTILHNACRYLADAQRPDGETDYFWNPLLLLASPEPCHRDPARRAAHHFARDLVPRDVGVRPYRHGLTSWRWGYKLLYLSEYYLRTGDVTVRPAMRQMADFLCLSQMRCGSWGHRAYTRGYGAVNQTGLTDWLALVLAREAGIGVTPAVLRRCDEFFGRFVRRGSVPYGDHLPYGSLENNGKCALSATVFSLLGRRDERRVMASVACLSYHGYEQAHTSSLWSWMWGPVGGMYAPPEEHRTLLDEIRWYYELARTDEGGFVCQPSPENISGRTWKVSNARFTTGAMGLVYALPYKRLRILGRAKGMLDRALMRAERAEDVRSTLAAIRANIAKGNVYLAHEQLSALKRFLREDRPEFAALAKATASGALAAEKQAAELYQPGLGARGWRLDDDRLVSIRRAAAMGDLYYAKLAREALPTLITPKPSVYNGRPRTWRPLAGTLGSQSYAVRLWQAGAMPARAADVAFDDGKWTRKKAPVQKAPDRQMLLRWRFGLESVPKGRVALSLSCPPDSRVYLNGWAVVDVVLPKAGEAATIPLHPKAGELLRRGPNVIAVHCRRQAAKPRRTSPVDVCLVHEGDAKAAGGEAKR